MAWPCPACCPGSTTPNATRRCVFAIAVIILVALTHALMFSPVLATLAFGLIARHRRIAFSQAEKNFGTLGNLLTVLLFVFMASTLEWSMVDGRRRARAGAGDRPLHGEDAECHSLFACQRHHLAQGLADREWR